MNRIFACTRHPDDWQQFLARRDKHWRRGYSARALASAWQGADGFPPEVERVLATPRHLAGPESRCQFLQMDASAPTFGDRAFDVIVCVQNGICAFAVDPEGLVREAMRMTRPGGRALFSTYAAAFWSERLGWFESQAAAGLVGAIDYDQTENGTMVCKDGFRAGTFNTEALRMLCRRLGVEPVITTVDDSSVFFEIFLPSAAQHPNGADAPDGLVH